MKVTVINPIDPEPSAVPVGAALTSISADLTQLQIRRIMAAPVAKLPPKPKYPESPFSRWNRPAIDISLQTSCAASIKVKKIISILPGWLDQGLYTSLVGPPGAGKSTLLCSIAARVTIGGDHPSWDKQEETPGSGNVIIITIEDDPAKTINPRLMAVGANLKRIYFVDGIRRYSKDMKSFTFSDENFDALIKFANSIGNIGLIIVDPAYLAYEGDDRSGSVVKDGYSKLVKLAEVLDCAVIGVVHDTKFSKGKAPLARLSGPRTTASAPRNILMVVEIVGGRIPNGATHVLMHAKSTNGKTDGAYAYSIEGVEVTDMCGEVIKTSKISWHGPLQGSQADILALAEGGNASGIVGAVKISTIDVAINLMKSVLQNGPRTRNDVYKIFKDAGVTTRDRDAAKIDMEIISKKPSGQGRHCQQIWMLPETASK